MVITLEHIKQAADLLRFNGKPFLERVIFVTPNSLQRMIDEGEVIDKEKQTVNDIKYEFVKNFYDA
jgi:hypothetical protein